MLQPQHKVYGAAFFMDCAAIMGVTVTPFIIFNQLGGGATASGAVTAFQNVAFGGACLLMAPLLALSRRTLWWAFMAALAFAVLYPVACLFRTVALYGLFVVLAHGTLSLYWPALHSWLGGVPDLERRRRYMAGFNVAWTLGILAGPAIAGQLYAYGYRLPFLGILAGALVAAAFVARLPEEKRNDAAEGDPSPFPQEPFHVTETMIYPVWMANAFSGALIGACIAVFSKRLNDLVLDNALVFGWWGTSPLDAGLDAPRLFSYLVSLMALSRTAVFFLFGRTDRWKGRIGYLLALQALCGAAFWVLGTSERYIPMAGCFLLLGTLGGTSYFASQYYSTANYLRKHHRAALHEGTVALGSAFGAFGYGLLADRLGTTWPFRFTPVLAACIIVLEWFVYSTRKTSVNHGRV